MLCRRPVGPLTLTNKQTPSKLTEHNRHTVNSLTRSCLYNILLKFEENTFICAGGNTECKTPEQKRKRDFVLLLLGKERKMEAI